MPVFPNDKDPNAFDAFQTLKRKLEVAALQSNGEGKAFVVECDASDIAVPATLNHGGRPVDFM